jgi:hypothetical protein
MKFDIKKYNAEYYRTHKEKMNAASRAWAKANPEKVNAWSKRWQKNNREYYREHQKMYREKIRNIVLLYRQGHGNTEALG